MRDRLNLRDSLGTNTGKTIGDVKMGRIKGFFLTRGFTFSENDLKDAESIKAAIVAAMLLPRNSLNKLFYFDGLREIDDNTGDANTQALADGYEEVLNDAIPRYVARNTKGIAQQQSICAFNGWQDGMYFLNDSNVLFYKGNSGGGRALPIGFFHATKPRPGGTGNIVTNAIRWSFADADVFADNIGAVKIDFNPADIVNLVDVVLLKFGTPTATVMKVRIETKYAGTDIYEAYDDALEQEAAWLVTDLTDNTEVEVTSAVKDDVNKCWTLTTASSPGLHRVELVTPAELKALPTPVEGIESLATNILRPA